MATLNAGIDASRARQGAQDFDRSADQISQAARRTGQDVERLDQDIAELGSGRGAAGLESLTGGFRGLGAAAAAAAAAIGANEIFQRLGELEQASVRLDIAQRNVGQSLGITRRELNNIAQDISGRSVRSISELNQLLAQTVQFGGQLEGVDLRRFTESVVGIAAVTGEEDLRGIAMGIRDAFSDLNEEGVTARQIYNSLRTDGIAVTEQEVQHLQAVIDTNDTLQAKEVLLQSIERLTRGAAEAERGTLPGLVARFGQATDDLITQLDDGSWRQLFEDIVSAFENPDQTWVDLARGISSTGAFLARFGLEYPAGASAIAAGTVGGVRAGRDVLRAGASVAERRGLGLFEGLRRTLRPSGIGARLAGGAFLRGSVPTFALAELAELLFTGDTTTAQLIRESASAPSLRGLPPELRRGQFDRDLALRGLERRYAIEVGETPPIATPSRATIAALGQPEVIRPSRPTGPTEPVPPPDRFTGDIIRRLEAAQRAIDARRPDLLTGPAPPTIGIGAPAPFLDLLRPQIAPQAALGVTQADQLLEQLRAGFDQDFAEQLRIDAVTEQLEELADRGVPGANQALADFNRSVYGTEEAANVGIQAFAGISDVLLQAAQGTDFFRTAILALINDLAQSYRSGGGFGSSIIGGIVSGIGGSFGLGGPARFELNPRALRPALGDLGIPVPQFQEGGFARRGTLGITGEQGRELVLFGEDARVIPNRQTERMLGGNVINLSINIEGDGDEERIREVIRDEAPAMLAQFQQATRNSIQADRGRPSGFSEF